MSMKLYYAGPSRATRARWMLEELGAPYQLVPVSLRRPRFERDPDFLAASPYGTVPALHADGVRLFESSAILIWLGDRYPDHGLAPSPDSEARADYLNWIAFCATTLETPLWQLARHRFILPEADRVASIKGLAKREWSELAPVIVEELGGRQYAAARRFTAADIMLTHTLRWANAAKLLEPYPELVAYMEHHVARPAFERALAAPR